MHYLLYPRSLVCLKHLPIFLLITINFCSCYEVSDVEGFIDQDVSRITPEIDGSTILRDMTQVDQTTPIEDQATTDMSFPPTDQEY